MADKPSSKSVDHACGYKREFRQLKSPDSKKHILRIMQWNILAQGFISLDQFVHCPAALLQLDHRCEQIVAEINRFNPHLICFQEADILPYILARLNKENDVYCSKFSPKRHSPCLMIPGNIGPDGVAIIYKRELLTLIHSEELALNRDSFNHALLCKFVYKEDMSHPSSSFNVLAIHLKAGQSNAWIRDQQCECLKESLAKRRNADQHPDPLFICGDFNANKNESAVNSLRNLTLPSVLESAYATMNNNIEPDYTTWKIRRNGCGSDQTEVCHTIDYILYVHELVDLLGVWWVPNKEDVGFQALPSPIFPSDHMNLIADFNLQ